MVPNKEGGGSSRLARCIFLKHEGHEQLFLRMKRKDSLDWAMS